MSREEGNEMQENVSGRIGELLTDELEAYAIFFVSGEGTIATWNPGVRRIFGFEAEQFIGSDSAIIFPATDVRDGSIDREQKHARATGTSVVKRWLCRSDQSTFWADGHVVAVADGDRFVGFAYILRDNTEGKRLENELGEASRQRDRFLATVSHELRTPLMAILGWVGVLQAGDLTDEERRVALATIERNAMMQRRLVESLLDCARLIVGQLTIDRSVVDVSAIVREEVESLRRMVIGRDITIDAELPAGPITMNADGDRLRQVLENLLSNATKFTLDGGAVSVRLSQSADALELVVSDSGVGIEPEFLPHLFERFRQATSTGPLAESGVGLGLCVARELVELHGGTITASSDGIGRGATFTVRLPRDGGLDD